MRIQATESLLLVVDLQDGLLPAIEGRESILDNAFWLVDLAEALDVPVLATEHCADKIGPINSALRSRLAADSIRAKTHFSAVAEGNLLDVTDRAQWIVIGVEAHVCVLQTVLDLLAVGRQVCVVTEGVSSRRLQDKELALQRMRQNGAEILTREMVAFEWLERADTPEFKAVLKEFIR